MTDFTPKQRKVIDLRDRDILVSAAAGSGKTTVLVERIIQKITDEKDPVDIDRILVVTFTRAAAKEMREKIRVAIDKALKDDPENERLMHQASYVFHSQITTIDSFCNHLLKNYFHRVGADPDFRIGDARELSLLSSEVMDRLLEEYYEADDEAFKKLVDTYSVRNRDDAISDMILDLYRAASAAPWPEEWLMGLLADYEKCKSWDDEAGEDPDWLIEMTDEAKRVISEAYDRAVENLRFIRSESPNCPYEEAVASDVAGLELLTGCETYDELYSGLKSFEFDKLSSKRFDEPVVGFKDRVKANRQVYKDIMSAVASDIIFQSRPDAKAAMLRVGENVKTLVRLTLDYSHRFFEKKQEKNVLDFSDVEHLALDILIDPKTKDPTETASELREYYDEVLIDEYQDSNYLQETILHTISGEDGGNNNYFMVGDVKQSIYGFRQARPEIFAKKYETFSREDSKQQRIDLDKNFRSRSQVIDSVNSIFAPLMDKRVGGVEYDDAATLKFGADYLLPAERQDYGTELLLAQKDASDPDDDTDISEFDGEGRIIAGRIRELMETFLVFDRKTESHRRLKYSDIVILMRGVKGRGTRLMETLMSFGIPAHVTDETGYFDTIEVDTVLSLLSLLDNPRQDITMAAVMRSPIFSFSNEQLAVIRSSDPDAPFYQAVLSYEGDEKHGKYLDFIDRYRSIINDTPIHKLLQMIYDDTGYVKYVSALPGGEVRAANLNRLVDMAVDFERTSFSGCFKFVNYIRQLKKYNQDVGTADLIGEDDDAVRIMTIHKSKGLEFPVVFLSGIKRKFNKSDSSGTMVMSASHGLAPMDIEPSRRIKSGYLYRSRLSKKITADMLGEEMRILYVALTRAKEKLIMTGTYEPGEDTEKYRGKKMSHYDRMKSICYADF
ncbi:MAG: helicase-exonuclease AddAB subunit AddA, partial [Lachnospiraceae bacterium]|nr:helicase-exonuclease AddAB subunit AddA [Lachnospiraceae bacterium]